MTRSLAFAAACVIAVASTRAGAATWQLPGDDQGARLVASSSAPAEAALFPSQRAALCGPVCTPNLFNSPTITAYGGSCADAYTSLVLQANAYMSANARSTCRANGYGIECAESTVATSGCLIVIGGYYAYIGHANFGCNSSSC